MTNEIKQLLIDCNNFIQPYNEGDGTTNELILRLGEVLEERENELPTIPLIAEIDACDLPCDVEDEMCGKEISTHYTGGSFSIDWNDDEDVQLPLTRKWLVETYSDAKDHRHFSVDPT